MSATQATCLEVVLSTNIAQKLNSTQINHNWMRKKNINLEGRINSIHIVDGWEERQQNLSPHDKNHVPLLCPSRHYSHIWQKSNKNMSVHDEDHIPVQCPSTYSPIELNFLQQGTKNHHMNKTNNIKMWFWYVKYK